MGDMVTFAANGGSCGGYLARGAQMDAPGVVVIQEWWGLNDHIKEVADRLAAAGYHALAPDLYHGTLATEPDEAGKMMMAMRIDEAAKDLRGAVRYVRQLSSNAVGTVGFCMGGALSLFTACENPDDVAACVDFYGGHSAVIYKLEQLRAPVLGLFGETDSFVSPEVVAKLDADLARLGKPHEFVTYPGADHAFFNDTRPDVYKPDAAADAWNRVLEFFRAHLRQTGSSTRGR